jgi:hypothetical protein
MIIGPQVKLVSVISANFAFDEISKAGNVDVAREMLRNANVCVPYCDCLFEPYGTL